MQHFQKSEWCVQEAVENSLLNRRNSKFVHPKQVDHNFLVQLHQPLKEHALKCRPPISWAEQSNQLKLLILKSYQHIIYGEN